MCRTSLSSGTWRFSFAALWALLFCSAACEAPAASVYEWGLSSAGIWANDPTSGANAMLAYCSTHPGICSSAGTYCPTLISLGPATSNYTPISFHYYGTTACTGSPATGSATLYSQAVDAPNCGAQGQDAFLGGTGTVPGYTCYQGCLYSTPQPATVITGSGSSPPTVYEAQSTGTACGDASSPNFQSAPTETTNGGATAACDPSGTVCAVSTSTPGVNCGEYNGDEVCVQSITKGTCVTFASGGAACVSASGTSVPTAPPAPNNGTPGTVANASAVVTTGGQTAYYYTPTTVAASAGGLVASAPASGGTAAPTGTGTAVSGTVSIGGTVSTSDASAAANGDCSASSGGCASNASGAGLPASTWSGDCSSMTECFEGFYAGISAAPILAGALAIETAWPSGSCAIGSVTLATFGERAFDYGTTACALWTDYIATPLSAIMLAIYAIAGIFIVLTA